MDTENELDEVVESQEDTTQEEIEIEELPDEEDDSVSLSKSELNKLKRKAIAYDSIKKTATKPEPKEDVSSDVSERFERLELKADGYSTDEIDEIMALGGQKVLNTKLIQSAIKAMRAEKKSKDASTDVTSKSPVYKKYTQDDLSKMSSAEMEKILSEQ